MNRRIAISGASGLIGSKLTSVFSRQGDLVYRLVRTKTVASSPDIYWDYRTQEIDSDKLEGMDAVIHLAGKPLDGQRWTPKVKQDIYASRIYGTSLVCKTLANLHRPPRVLISASATDYYAESDSTVGESDGLPGKGFIAEMCGEWEAATDFAREAGIRVVSLRIPSVLAVSGHSLLAAVLPLFRLGLGPVLGSGKQLMCFIALDDMVRAIDHIIESEQLAGPVNVLAPEQVTNREFAMVLGKILHRPVFLRIPALVLRIMMGEVAEAFLAGDTSLRPDKLLATGFTFLYPDIESALCHELLQSN